MKQQATVVLVRVDVNSPTELPRVKLPYRFSTLLLPPALLGPRQPDLDPGRVKVGFRSPFHTFSGREVGMVIRDMRQQERHVLALAGGKGDFLPLDAGVRDCLSALEPA